MEEIFDSKESFLEDFFDGGIETKMNIIFKSNERILVPISNPLQVRLSRIVYPSSYRKRLTIRIDNTHPFSRLNAYPTIFRSK